MYALPAAAAPSLAEALDNAELLFTTVGDGERYGQTDASQGLRNASFFAHLLTPKQFFFLYGTPLSPTLRL